MTKSAKISAALLTGGVLVVTGTVILPKLNNKNQIQNQIQTEVKKVVNESSQKEKVEDFLRGKFYSFNGVIESHRRYYNFHKVLLEDFIGPRPQTRNNGPQNIKYFKLEDLLKSYQFKNKDFSLDHGTKIKGFRQYEIDKLSKAVLAYMLRIPINERNTYDWKRYIKIKYEVLEKCKKDKDKKCYEDTKRVIEARLEPYKYTIRDIENILKEIDY